MRNYWPMQSPVIGRYYRYVSLGHFIPCNFRYSCPHLPQSLNAMNISFFYCFRFLLLITAFFTPLARANVYFDLSASQIEINTPAASTKPAGYDLRLGYAVDAHQLELSYMSSTREGTLNQLNTRTPSIISVFYHYLPYPRERLKLHLIVGASQVEVESSYSNTSNSLDQYNGVALGIGFDESFASLPELKLKAEYLRLYSGDNLDINALVLGIRYEF